MVEEESPVVEEVEATEESELAPEEPAIHIPVPPLFGKYSMDDIVVADPGLVRYVNLRGIAIPHQGAKYANRQFGKAKTSIVERLVNAMMRGAEYTGKKLKSYKVVEDAFAIIAERTKENPVQILVQALQRCAPKEEITRLRYGGIKVPKAVDCAPQRRLDIALRNIAKGAREATFKTKKTAAQCLADEILKASKGDMASFGVAKKEDIERVAKSAR
ncbi:MAG: 30S ribosomal protein S7 [Euryarchaeota archaeon]|nr:30S ribosomal protein S7 [Euryarchaeota archaeon]